MDTDNSSEIRGNALATISWSLSVMKEREAALLIPKLNLLRTLRTASNGARRTHRIACPDTATDGHRTAQWRTHRNAWSDITSSAHRTSRHRDTHIPRYRHQASAASAHLVAKTVAGGRVTPPATGNWYTAVVNRSPFIKNVQSKDFINIYKKYFSGEVKNSVVFPFSLLVQNSIFTSSLFTSHGVFSGLTGATGNIHFSETQVRYTRQRKDEPTK